MSFFMTHFQAATTVGRRDKDSFVHPNAVQNFFFHIVAAGDAAVRNSTWPGDKMRVIGAAGMSG